MQIRQNWKRIHELENEIEDSKKRLNWKYNEDEYSPLITVQEKAKIENNNEEIFKERNNG